MSGFLKHSKDNIMYTREYVWYRSPKAMWAISKAFGVGVVIGLIAGIVLVMSNSSDIQASIKEAKNMTVLCPIPSPEPNSAPKAPK